MPDLGSSNTPVPMPRGYVGGATDFSVLRIIDGHKSGEIGAEGRNCYYPNGGYDMSSESDEDSMDCSSEEY